MLTVHQLWLLLLVNAGVATAGTLVVARFVGFPSRDRGRDDLDARDDRAAPTVADGTWYDEAVALATEVRTTVSTSDGPTDHDRLTRRLLPLSARIRGHVRSAPSTADADVYRSLYDLGVACQRIAVESRPPDTDGGHADLERRLDALRAEASDLQERATVAG